MCETGGLPHEVLVSKKEKSLILYAVASESRPSPVAPTGQKTDAQLVTPGKGAIMDTM